MKILVFNVGSSSLKFGVFDMGIEDSRVFKGKFESFKNDECTLHDLMLEGIQYEKIANHYWEMSRIEDEAENEIVRYLSNLYPVQNQEKCLFDMVEYDSEVERQFARDLDSNEYVRLFVKLPSWFKIDTPIGPYNPDWAFVTHRDEKLYFVRETKSTLDNQERRTKEKQKILCGKRHFETIDVDYGVVTKLAEVNFWRFIKCI